MSAQPVSVSDSWLARPNLITFPRPAKQLRLGSKLPGHNVGNYIIPADTQSCPAIREIDGFYADTVI